jgi:hypothetical protein
MNIERIKKSIADSIEISGKNSRVCVLPHPLTCLPVGRPPLQYLERGNYELKLDLLRLKGVQLSWVKGRAPLGKGFF